MWAIRELLKEYIIMVHTDTKTNETAASLKLSVDVRTLPPVV